MNKVRIVVGFFYQYRKPITILAGSVFALFGYGEVVNVTNT